MQFLDNVQNVIGYRFKNKDLLQQAFVRRSYSKEHGGQNNEVLEFIGDKALDFVVIRLMMERFGVITEDKSWDEFKLTNPKYFKTKLSEGKFTDIKADLVQKKSLASCMEDLGFQDYLIMGHGDVENHVEEEDSVKEDLFEAIIGAVTLDCDYDFETITKVVETMIDFESYFNNEKNINYVGIIQEYTQENDLDLPNYEYYTNVFGGYICYLDVEGFPRLTGTGESKAKARKAAAKELYEILDDSGYFSNDIASEIGEISEEHATRQVNELVQKGIIEEPIICFDSYLDEESNKIIWECELIDDDGNSFINEAYSKSEAKRLSCFEYLEDLYERY